MRFEALNAKSLVLLNQSAELLLIKRVTGVSEIERPRRLHLALVLIIILSRLLLLFTAIFVHGVHHLLLQKVLYLNGFVICLEIGLRMIMATILSALISRVLKLMIYTEVIVGGGGMTKTMYATRVFLVRIRLIASFELLVGPGRRQVRYALYHTRFATESVRCVAHVWLNGIEQSLAHNFLINEVYLQICSLLATRPI